MRSRFVFSSILALTVASTAAFAQDSNVNVVYVFSGTVDFVSGPFGVALGIEQGDERGYSIGFNFGRPGEIDESIADLGFPSTFPTFLGGFYADLVAGSLQGSAESPCFFGVTLATPSSGEGNGGITVGGETSIFIGYMNDFISISDSDQVDPKDWTAGTQVFVALRQNLWVASGSGRCPSV